MAEKLLTESELDNYLATIDMNSVDNKRVLTALQMIHSHYMEDILYFLVTGVIQIQELYKYNINNLSAKVIIDNASLKGDSLINHKQFYKDRLTNMPTFKNFMAQKRLESNLSFARMLISSNKFNIEFVIDELGNIVGSFPSMNAVMEIYDNVVFSPTVQRLYSTAMTLANNIKNNFNIMNLPEFTASVLSQMADYRFIKSSDGQLNHDIGAETLVGFIMRARYLDLPYIDLLENTNHIIIKMAEQYEADVTKTGYDTVKSLLSDELYAYNLVFNENTLGREKIILKDLARLIFIRRTIYATVYGISYSDSTSVNYELETYNKLIELFTTIRLFGEAIITELRIALEGNTNA